MLFLMRQLPNTPSCDFHVSYLLIRKNILLHSLEAIDGSLIIFLETRFYSSPETFHLENLHDVWCRQYASKMFRNILET